MLLISNILPFYKKMFFLRMFIALTPIGSDFSSKSTKTETNDGRIELSDSFDLLIFSLTNRTNHKVDSIHSASLWFAQRIDLWFDCNICWANWFSIRPIRSIRSIRRRPWFDLFNLLNSICSIQFAQFASIRLIRSASFPDSHMLNWNTWSC